MLSQFMRNDFSILEYTQFNDELLYIDRSNLRHNFDVLIVDPKKAHVYEGNFYGLLAEMDVHPSLWLQTLYINGLTSPYDYKGSMTLLRKPVKLSIPKK